MTEWCDRVARGKVRLRNTDVLKFGGVGSHTLSVTFYSVLKAPPFSLHIIALWVVAWYCRSITGKLTRPIQDGSTKKHQGNPPELSCPVAAPGQVVLRKGEVLFTTDRAWRFMDRQIVVKGC